MRFSMRARAATLGACALVLTVPAPVAAAPAPITTQLRYDPNRDASAWYWELQKDQEVSAGPVTHRGKLPNPQRPGTLPVAYENGEPRKLSALKFNLADRGVPAGSKVTMFRLTIVEATEGGEVPTVNADGKVLQACSAGSEWTGSDEPEVWEVKPTAKDVCAKGVRMAPPSGEQGAVTWTFDLSAVAAGWGTDPFDNHGVVFSSADPGTGAAGTWQINLKVPVRDNESTPIDEGKETADRVQATVTYVPGEPATPPGDGSGGGSGGFGGGSGGGAPPPADLPADGDPPAAGESPGLVSSVPFRPTMPWYVWLLIPAALVASYLVRGALTDAPAGGTGRGVIEAIKRHNETRRGGPLLESTSPWARLARGIAARGVVR